MKANKLATKEQFKVATYMDYKMLWDIQDKCNVYEKFKIHPEMARVQII